MEIEVKLPDNMQVFLSSNLSSVVATGTFKSFHADLKEGYCRLLSFKGNATLNTFKGNIYVETVSGDVEAQSRNGAVHIVEEMNGTNILKLTSINGDISVLKTK